MFALLLLLQKNYWSLLVVVRRKTVGETLVGEKQELNIDKTDTIEYNF